MLVAELIAPRQFQLVDRAPAEPGPGEIQVRVTAIGVCGSDLHSYAEGAVGDSPCAYPQVLGHEPAGTVVKVGRGVTGFAPGDRAALEPAVYCYHCEFCMSGHHNVCANIRFLSTPGIPGFFREFVNLPPECVLPIPREMSFGLAAVAEPLAIAIHSMKFAQIALGETVAVLGAGPIGLLTIVCAKLAGAGRIIAVDPVAHRREFAKLMGADAVIDPNAVEPAAEIRQATGNRGVDCVLDCAAKEHTTNDAIRAVRNARRVVITGIHSATHVPFEVSPMRRKELTIFNVRRSNNETHAALEMISARPGLFEPLLTHTRKLDKIEDAFQIAEHYTDGVGKMIIEP
jgi:L-iditol 2-dehydrogenase